MNHLSVNDLYRSFIHTLPDAVLDSPDAVVEFVAGELPEAARLLANAVIRLIARRPVGRIDPPGPPPIMAEAAQRIVFESFDNLPDAVDVATVFHHEMPAYCRFLAPVALGLSEAEGLFFHQNVMLRLAVGPSFWGQAWVIEAFVERTTSDPSYCDDPA